jgi:hypothetical protein
MILKRFTSNSVAKELLFQVLLHITVFIFFAFEKNKEGIELVQIYFFLNFALSALIINYMLLPLFLYKHRYWQFVVYLLILLGVVVFVEEVVLEQMFYPDTRGKKISKMFYNLLSVLPTVTILVGFKFAWDALIKQREVLELKNSVKQSELQFLKSQINPHFLFNNMNNLYAYAVEESPRTPEIILEFSSVLRYMLYECKSRFVPLKKEISHLENYINLSKLQVEGRGEVYFEIGAMSSGLKIAPLILSVFVENAFKHSVSSQTGNIFINVSVAVNEKGNLHFICDNTFLEQSNTDNLDSGIGLENVKKRLDLIYPNSHQLDIQIINDHYKVELDIELQNR